MSDNVLQANLMNVTKRVFPIIIIILIYVSISSYSDREGVVTSPRELLRAAVIYLWLVPSLLATIPIVWVGTRQSWHISRIVVGCNLFSNIFMFLALAVWCSSEMLRSDYQKALILLFSGYCVLSFVVAFVFRISLERSSQARANLNQVSNT